MKPLRLPMPPLEQAGVAPDGPLAGDDLLGLPLTDKVRDES